jgi:hypothetical protein
VTRRALSLALLLALPAPAHAASERAGPPDAATVIARVVEAYGGRARLEKVRSYRLEGTLTAVRRGNLTVPTSRVFERPSRLRVEIHYPGHPEIRVLDGTHGWRTDEQGVTGEATGPFLEAMILQTARAHVPWILAGAADRAKLIEPLEHEGDSLIGLEFPLSSILTFRAYVHPASWRVVISQGLLVHGGMTTHFETYYEAFRKVEGVLFAFRERNYASGAHTGWTDVETVILNPVLPPSTFTLPRPAAGDEGREG